MFYGSVLARREPGLLFVRGIVVMDGCHAVAASWYRSSDRGDGAASNSLGRTDERLRVAQRVSLGIQIPLAEDCGGPRRTSDSAVFHQSGIRQWNAGLPLHEFDKLAARHQWECGVVHHPSFGFANFAEAWRSDGRQCRYSDT